MKRLLIYEHLTGGGMAGEPLQESWLAEGQAMRRSAIRAFRQAGCEVVTLQDQRLPAEDHTEFVSIHHKNNLRPALLQLMHQTDHGLLIAPETGGCLAEIATLAEQKLGWHLGCTSEAVRLCGDKLESANFFQKNQIRHPQTWAMNDSGHGWQQSTHEIVIKPRDGAGSLDTFKAHSSNTFHFIEAEKSHDFLIQEFCEGRSMSLSALCDGHGGVKPVAVFDHNRQLLPVGRSLWQFQYQTPRQLPPDFIKNLNNGLAALKSITGLHGWVGVDFIWNQKTGVDTVIEINPRLTMSFTWLDQAEKIGGQVARDWLYLMDQSRYV